MRKPGQTKHKAGKDKIIVLFNCVFPLYVICKYPFFTFPRVFHRFKELHFLLLDWFYSDSPHTATDISKGLGTERRADFRHRGNRKDTGNFKYRTGNKAHTLTHI